MPLPNQIVLASGNLGKLAELSSMLTAVDLKLPDQYKSPDETGLSYRENALIKARACADQNPGHAVLADDSGLEVEALQGAPGLHSARYAGADATDEQNWRKLLDELSRYPEGSRKACFRCCLVLLRPGSKPVVAEAHWEGVIGQQAQQAGSGTGFGYDPVFILPGWGCSAAQLPPVLKNRTSHRARAVRSLLKQV